MNRPGKTIFTFVILTSFSSKH